MSVELYGIGNALVDQEYAIQDDFLSSTGLTKGTMQLAESDAQYALISALNNHTTSAGQVSGGSGANSIYAFSALGGQAFYACRVGNDDLGQFYLKDLAAANVHVSPISEGTGTTGTCLVLITPDGERTMHTHLGITTDLSIDQVDLKPLQSAQYLYIEGYLATSQTAREAVRHARAQARAQKTKIAISLSDPAMVQYAREGLVDLIDDGVDILFCNELEAQMFTGEAVLEQALSVLLTHSKLVVITRGAEGALIGYDDVIIPVPPQVAPQVLDTNGAGDAFSGSFLFGLSRGFTLSDCGFLATAISSTLVGQFGARLRREQYAEILDKTISKA
ncbi:adenosine kinase [Aquirhabdus sp.]|uniref:adenosine kinase n=1 Tax=Aquirhabdus sp. TaxID=2824160 RepID=UPI00396C62A9